MVGLPSVALNTPCNEGSLASRRVVSSLALPDKAPDLGVGAVPLSPGAVVPPGTPIGIDRSGCFGDGVTVPAVVWLTFAVARLDLHAVGLTGACYGVDRGATTPAGSARQTVLAQTPGVGTVLQAGSPVSLTMHARPQ